MLPFFIFFCICLSCLETKFLAQHHHKYRYQLIVPIRMDGEKTRKTRPFSSGDNEGLDTLVLRQSVDQTVTTMMIGPVMVSTILAIQHTAILSHFLIPHSMHINCTSWILAGLMQMATASQKVKH